MSIVRGFGLNGKSFYTNVAKPQQVNLSFTVTPSNGLGITALKSNSYVENVFMHTSTTPTSNNGFLNPNPAVGFALVQLKQNFNVFLGAQCILTTSLGASTKVDNAALTIGGVYTISTLGDATAAQWTTLGVPRGITPAVGVTFTALVTGAGTANTSTSRVAPPVSSGITLVEVVGTTNTMVPANVASNAGEWVTLQFSAATSSSVTTLIPAAPTTGSICSLSLYFDGSSVTIDGL